MVRATCRAGGGRDSAFPLSPCKPGTLVGSRSWGRSGASSSPSARAYLQGQRVCASESGRTFSSSAACACLQGICGLKMPCSLNVMIRCLCRPRCGAFLGWLSPQCLHGAGDSMANTASLGRARTGLPALTQGLLPGVRVERLLTRSDAWPGTQAGSSASAGLAPDKLGRRQDLHRAGARPG